MRDLQAWLLLTQAVSLMVIAWVLALTAKRLIVLWATIRKDFLSLRTFTDSETQRFDAETRRGNKSTSTSSEVKK